MNIKKPRTNGDFLEFNSYCDGLQIWRNACVSREAEVLLNSVIVYVYRAAEKFGLINVPMGRYNLVLLVPLHVEEYLLII